MRLNDSVFQLLAVPLAVFTFLSIIVTSSYADPIDAAYVLNMSSGQPAADTGKISDSSLLGSDANNNGVRDDVEKWIATTFPQNAVTRAVALQLGLAMQRVMASGNTVDETAAASLKTQIRDGLECLLAVADDTVQAKIFGELLAVIVNTPARAKLVEQLEAKFPEPDGVVLLSPSVNACLISPDQLSNKEKI